MIPCPSGIAVCPGESRRRSPAVTDFALKSNARLGLDAAAVPFPSVLSHSRDSVRYQGRKSLA